MIRKFLLAIIAINVLLSAAVLFRNNLYFHTDIARDFLLIDDIVTEKNITLIGPRSSIPGVFHGPLWLYMQIPAFILGNGNPVVVGYFWLALSILSIWVVYWITRELIGKDRALVSAAVYSAFTIPYVKNMFNPFGSVLLSPVYVYLLVQYFKKYDWRYLLAAFFTLGLIIQFQMAFGLPMLLLTLPLLGYQLWKKKKWKHGLSISGVFAAQAAFILFELRNNFFQIRSGFAYVQEHSGEKMAFFAKLLNRFEVMTLDGLGLFLPTHRLAMVIVFPIIAYGVYRLYKKGKLTWTNFYGLFVYFYVGFWIASLVFSGPIWGYYYWPFLPLTIMFVVGLWREKAIAQKVVVAVLVLVAALQIYNEGKFSLNAQKFDEDAGSWRFNKSVAEMIFEDAPEEFGYFIYTPDQFGYTPRYPMQYIQNNQNEKQSYGNQKKAVTYLIIAPPPSNRPELDGQWWKTDQVRIKGPADHTFLYPNGFRVLKFQLSEDQQAVEPDPNIVNSLHFR